MARAPDCLLNVCSSYSSSGVEALIFYFQQQKIDLNLFREHVSGTASSIDTANSVLQENLLNTRLLSGKSAVSRNVLYVRNAVKKFQKQLQAANTDKDISFRPTASRYKVKSVQNSMESKVLAYIYRVIRIEVMSSANENVI